MKKIISFSIIVVLCLAANLPAFSQKIKSISIKKLPAPRNLPQANVKLSSAEAFSDGNGVYLRWQAEFETQNLGFFVYRVSAKGAAQLVSPSMVGGASLTSTETVVYGGKYSFFDADGKSANSYYIESLGANGKRQAFEPIYPKFVKSLTSVAGSSSQELANMKAGAKPGVESNLLNLPEDLHSEIEGNTLPPDIFTQRWVAAQPGVKISVKQEGIYRVSRAELQNAGFNVSAPGNRWQLYADGKQQSIIVGDKDAYIEFYGNGIDTAESATKVYYLIVGVVDGKRMDTTVLRPLSSSVVSNNYFQSFLRKDRQTYISAEILNGDAENFFSNVPIIGANSPTPTPVIFNLNLTGVDFTMPNATIEIGIQGITSTPHQLLATINGEPMTPITGNGKVLMNGAFQVPISFLREGANTLQLQTIGGQGDISLTESIKISYSRKYEAIQNRLSFYTSNYRTSTLSGFTSPNIRIFDLTVPDEPKTLSNLTIVNNGGNFSVNLPSSRGRAIFAAEDSAILTAGSIVANTPSTLSTSEHNAQLIIVSYKDWLTQANDWANYRRSQGMTVEVVDIEDILDEFGYGSVSSGGITDFFQFAKTNWQTPPNYILLLGDTSYDYRNYENRAFQNFIPTKRVDTVYEETGSDEALCDFNNDGLSEIAVGRIPARNAQNVTQALNKTMTFESGLATAFSRGALFASDLPNGYDFQGLSERLASQLPPSIPKHYINRADPDAHNLLIANMNQGRYIINYSGHGSTGGWEGNFITIADALALNNAPNYSLFISLTCLNGYFLRTDFDSLGEAMLKSQNGGASAVWASTGKTTPDVQEVMATRFYNQLATGNMNRMGDLIQDAKQNLNGGRDVRLSWALLGDPTLKVKP
jgi:hypothetical protein